MFKRLPIWVGFALLVMNFTAQAELRVVVTPKHSAESKDLSVANLSNSPVSRKVLQREEFSGELTTLSGVLEKHADITVRKTGGLGGFSTLSIRGSSSRQLLVLVDGVPVNNANTGGVDLSQFSLDSLQSLEIYKGNLPMEFGLSSAGGAINLVTRRARGTTTEVGVGLGSFSTQKLSLTQSYRSESGRLLAALDQMIAENDFSFTNDAGTPLAAQDDFSDKRTNNSYLHRSALLNYEYYLSSQQRLQFSLNLLHKEKEMPANSNTILADSQLDTQQSTYAVSYFQELANALSLQLSYRNQQLDQQYRDTRANVGLRPQAIDYVTPKHNFYARLQKEYAAGRWNIQLSADQEKFKSRHITLPNAVQSQSSCFFQGNCDLNFQRKQWRFGAGGDYRLGDQNWSANASVLSIEDDNESGVAIVKGQQLGADLYPTIQLGWVLHRRITWRANASNAVRVPSSYELFGDTGLSRGNASLKTERSQLLELVAELRKNGWLASTTIFQRNIQDLIVPERDSRGITIYENVSNARIMGLEAEVKKHWSNGWKSGGRIYKINTEVDSQIPAFDGQQIAGTFHFQSRVFLGWESSSWDVQISRIFSSGLYYNRTNSVLASDKNQSDITASYRIRQWRIDTELRNVLDENFSGFDGQPSEGRSFYVFSKYQF